MVGQLEHFARLAFWPSAYKTYIFILAFLLLLACTVCRLFLFFYFFLRFGLIFCYVHNLELFIVVKVVV